MTKRRLRRPSAAMVVAGLALFVAMTGTAVATQRLVGGDKLIEPRSLSGNRLRNHTLTGRQINLHKLGTVPRAARATAAVRAGYATSAGTATSATTAASATNAAQLGGAPAAAFQSRVSSTCAAGSGIQQVNADGSVGCGPVRFYSGRLVTALTLQTTTVFTIPGIAQVVSLNCTSSDANVEMENLGTTTDIWSNSDGSYLGTNWAGVISPNAATAGATWHLGQGSGTGATVITVTVSTEATGSHCIYQGYAQVMSS